MTIKDIVRLSAVYLNRDSVVEYLDGGEDVGALYAVNTLVTCANVVINELATTYINMTVTDKVNAVKGKINFSSLSQTPLEILGVYDIDGDKLWFSVCGDYIKTSERAVAVEYKYLPPNYGLTDKIGFTPTQTPIRMLAYGVVAEYCLIERAFDEGVVWRNRFNDTLSVLCLPASKTVRARSFV